MPDRLAIPALRALGLALVAALLLAAGKADAKVLLPQHASPDRYLEIVREKSPCPLHDCFVEYLLLADGTAVRKTFASEDYEKNAKIDIRRLETDPAAAVFSSFADFFSASRPPAKWTSNGGQAYYYAGGAPQTYSTPDINGQDFSGLFTALDTAFNAAPASDDFYVHGYYEVTGGETEDYHVFSNGQVIFSTFSRQSDRMLATAMNDYDPAGLQKLRDVAKDALSAGTSPYRKCAPETGLEYGLVEVESAGRYVKSHTCADTDDGVSRLFRYLRNMPAPAAK